MHGQLNIAMCLDGLNRCARCLAFSDWLSPAMRPQQGRATSCVKFLLFLRGMFYFTTLVSLFLSFSFISAGFIQKTSGD